MWAWAFVHLTQDQAALGFDYLLVFGTKVLRPGTDGTAELVKLLDAHHYTDGLSFVLPGTPSNNTPDAPSGFSSTDPGHEASYAAERSGTAYRAGDGSNADVLTAALGLNNGSAMTLANLGNANTREQMDARHMNRALWPATWGYFLWQMMRANGLNETILTADNINWARGHFIDYVRAGGPLPALRVGKQPYGILPVTSLNSWKPKTGQDEQFARDSALKGFLIKLREVWQGNLSQVPRVGRSADNPDQDFTDIFSMDGVSSSYAIRHLMGETYLQELWSVLAPGDQTYWWNKQQELTKAGLNTVGLNWDPRLLHATYSGWYRLLKGPVTQAELSEDGPLQPNYIELLLNSPDLEQIHQETYDEFQPIGLLYSVLRHGMLLEYWTAALNILYPPGFAYLLEFREKELINMPTPSGLGVFPPWWELLKRPVAGVTDNLGSYLHTLRSAPGPDLAPRVATLIEFRESLTYLNTLSAAKLQRLFAGTLDLCSHRLDAWITSFATKRLHEMRQENPTGILLGGYGWVMNLRPSSPPELETAPDGEPGSLFRPANNAGYTHTPSLVQAATVAVLRSGHLTHAEAGKEDLLAIDLSSERVRLANWLLDGVRQGQSLGALLGYRFERRLQEARPPLGQFILGFRQVAPLVANKIQQTTEPGDSVSVESIAANNVVDGLALQRAWRSLAIPSAGRSATGSALDTLLQSSHDSRGALEAELNLLDDAVDAVSDALLAESVHHAVQGNPSRTASTLDAVASGAAPPPELEVVRTPRTGAALTYRLITLFGGPPKLPPEWESPVVPYRVNAEPYLNAWVAQLLGNPVRVRCVIEQVDPATQGVVASKEIRVSELHLSPLDFIYAAEGSRDAQPAEIERRIFYAIIRQVDGFAADAILRVNPSRAADWPVSDLSYGEFAELVRTARKLITGARGIDASELNLPEQNQPAAVDVEELETRASEAEQALRLVQTDLAELLSHASAVDLESLREVMLRSAHLGIAGAVPFSATGDAAGDRDALLLQGGSIAKVLDQRVSQLTTLTTSFTPLAATDDEKRNHHLARLRAIFGDSFVVLPRFSVGNAVELEKALADSTKVQDNDALAVTTWFQRASRVREGMARLDALLCYAEALGLERLNLRIAQLPYQENDRWVGLPLKAGQPLSLSRFSLVIQSAGTLDVKKPLAGLLIDEWVEVMPNARETTGMVFQYDQPDAAPPQCILLAVPPDLDKAWDLWSLQQVLLETLDLGRIRAVDPETLDEVGHYLPALYFAVNTEHDTVSTDFAKLK